MTAAGGRAELTPLIPGDPRMASLPKGFWSFSRRDGKPWIDHTDPRILVSLELLDMIVRGECRPEVTIRVRDGHYAEPGCWLGAVIRVEAANRTVLYRLTEYKDFCLAYVAEWPD